jgi:amidase
VSDALNTSVVTPAIDGINRFGEALIEDIMDKYHLDALLIPVSTTGSATYESIAFVYEAVSSNAGLPGITLNAGYTNIDKMPIGVELIARQFAEGTLLEIAYGYEKHTPPRILPTMPEKNELLEILNIPEYNNILMKIGYHTYEKVLIKSKSDNVSKDLTPEVFRMIVGSELKMISKTS